MTDKERTTWPKGRLRTDELSTVQIMSEIVGRLADLNKSASEILADLHQIDPTRFHIGMFKKSESWKAFDMDRTQLNHWFRVLDESLSWKPPR